jgi:adenylyl-sulfate kinase
MNRQRSPNVRQHSGLVNPDERAQALGQRGLVVWFTGLSGSGKSTIAMALEQKLIEAGLWVTTLDGDNVRHGLSGDLGFSPKDRAENLRRIGHVGKLFFDAGLITLCSFVSPSESARQAVRQLFPEDGFLLAHVSTPIETCESRDPKGLYRLARAGTIKDMTGISAPYEAPIAPDYTLDTSALGLSQIVDTLAADIMNRARAPVTFVPDS